jgi:hypothetical protein
MDIEQLVNAVYAYTVPYRLVVAGLSNKSPVMITKAVSATMYSSF